MLETKSKTSETRERKPHIFKRNLIIFDYTFEWPFIAYEIF
ncbi:hypothetical protein BCF50_1771 [Chryseobacterium daecheongense]|uniref:Uncharacterized protein n=1 Tax=Chryseobacterium daecheongense TaxID=192389 RepID=A0ABY2FWB7_9FLAO|nr:hypothetical protein BCF50_1771 [Chryseobacterium daecheongense]